MSKQFGYNVKRGFLCRIFENSFQKVWITLNDLWINQKKNIILGVTLALDSKLVFLQKCDGDHTTQSEGPPFWFSPSEEECVSYDIVLPWNVLNEASDEPGSMESEYW